LADPVANHWQSDLRIPGVEEVIMVRMAFPLAMAGAFLLTGSLSAQDFPEFPKPTESHEFLQRFVGKWKVDQEATMAPGQPPIQSTGTIESRSLGGFWVINEMKSEMMGASFSGVQTIGFSAKQNSYVGTWVDSMTDMMWHYKGTLDDTGQILTLEADGPNVMAEGKLTKYHDIYEFKSNDKMMVYSKMLGEDGEWITFMTGTATRVK
jgi:hypothetical protein